MANTKHYKFLAVLACAVFLISTGYAMSPTLEGRLLSEIQHETLAQEQYNIKATELRRQTQDIETRIREIESELPILKTTLQKRLDKIEELKLKWEKSQSRIDAYDKTLGLKLEQ